MRLWLETLLGAAALLPVIGCGLLPTGGTRNPFLTLTETIGVPPRGDEEEPGAPAGGVQTEQEFRRLMTLTFVNNHPFAELNTSVAAWVYPNSLRSAAQQDALLADGYVQLTTEVTIGSVFTLPPGTFVYNGPGTAGATAVRIEPPVRTQTGAGQEGGAVTLTPREVTFTLITPDVVLVFLQPPHSCESVAFSYSVDGDVLTSEPTPGGIGQFDGATGQGGLKTLAQVDAYQCEPLKPGMFLKLTGGVRELDEFFESENLRFDFFAVPDAAGNFAVVTISSGS